MMFLKHFVLSANRYALLLVNVSVVIITYLVQGEHRGAPVPTLPQLPLLTEKDLNTLIEQSLILINQSATLTEFIIFISLC